LDIVLALAAALLFALGTMRQQKSALEEPSEGRAQDYWRR
jgi:hypothetical protein